MGSNRNVTIPLVEKALRKVYENHKQPQKVHYAEVVAKLKCEEENLKPGSYTKKEVRVSVGRALDVLVERGDVIKEGKYYWGIEEYADYCGREDFKKYVIPEKVNVEFIMSNTYLVKLKSADDHEVINHAVLKYFGKKALFASFICDNVLIIVFNQSEQPYDCLVKVNEIVKQAYLYHNTNEKE